MHATDVVGYTFDAENCCPSCMRRITANACEAIGHNSEFVPLDKLLDMWRVYLGFGEDESEYDSNDFPKVIFASDIEPSEACGRCGELLVED